MSCTIFHEIQAVKPKDKEDLIRALKELCAFDNDFNGNNGVEYLCPEAEAGGYESNMDYYIETLKNESDYDFAEDFICMWMIASRYYKYDVKYIKNEDGYITAISLMCVNED